MTLNFSVPKNKNTYYISNIDQPYYIDIIDVSIKKLVKLQNNKGYVLSLYINDDLKTKFDNIDSSSKTTLIANNNQWFNNNLNDDDIHQLFNTSYCNQYNMLNVYLTDKTIINFENKVVEKENIFNILSDTNQFNKYIVNIKLQHIGLYIYPSHTINKWGIKLLKIFDVEDENLEITEKKEIENFWKEQLEECNTILDQQKIAIENKKKSLNEMYYSVIEEKSQNKDWESKMTNFIKKIQNIIF